MILTIFISSVRFSTTLCLAVHSSLCSSCPRIPQFYSIWLLVRPLEPPPHPSSCSSILHTTYTFSAIFALFYSFLLALPVQVPVYPVANNQNKIKIQNADSACVPITSVSIGHELATFLLPLPFPGRLRLVSSRPGSVLGAATVLCSVLSLSWVSYSHTP